MYPKKFHRDFKDLPPGVTSIYNIHGANILITHDDKSGQRGKLMVAVANVQDHDNDNSKIWHIQDSTTSLK